jgi:toxin-antitoxin system PIN domain toxin
LLTPDVNVLVYAHRKDAVDHERYRLWLDELVHSDVAFGIADSVLAGFVRVVTHPRVFKTPTPLETALEFAEALRNRPNAVLIGPDERHWHIFTQLCRAANAKGNLVPDAYLAALAVESGCEWITTDRDFARFDGLRWRHPFA